MAGLFGGGKKTNSDTAPAYTGLSVQTSAEGLAIPILLGTNRLTFNLIWYGNFQTYSHTEPSETGGKGGGGNNSSIVSYTYSAGVVLALCEALGAEVIRIWKDKEVYTAGTDEFNAILGTFHNGADGQTADAWLLSYAPTEALAYRKLCYLVNSALDLGESSNLPNLSFEVKGNLATAYTGTAATGTATVSGGAVTVVTITSGGSRYITPPSVVFSGAGAGSGATAEVTALTMLGAIQTISITNGGSGYVTAPTITVDGGGYGGGAVLTAVLTGDVVTSITIDSAGIGYRNFPTLTFEPGRAATATATISNGAVTAVTITDGGSQYAAAPTVTFSGGFRGDANPADVVESLIINTIYGTSFPAANLGTLSTFHDYCQAAGLFISPAITDQKSARDIITEIVEACNSGFRWSEGVLEIIPHGDQDLSGNGATYTAPTAPLFDLTDDHFLHDEGEPPVKLIRKRPADVYNSIQTEYLNPDKDYNAAIAPAKDLARVLTYGLRPKDPSQKHFFCLESAAMLSAQLELQREQIQNKYMFRLGWAFIGLDTEDIVTLTESTLGLTQQWVRILEIEENENGDLDILAEEYLNGTGNAPIYGKQASAGYIPNYNADADPANAPVFMEVPSYLAADPTKPELWIAVSGSGTSWGGCEVWTSQDGASYKLAGMLYGAARYGTLTGNLPAYSSGPIDETNTASVSVNTTQQLLSGTQADATALNTLCWIDGELVAYATATLTGAQAYNLTYLVRGAYGTTAGLHSIGASFVRLDNAIFKNAYDTSRIDKTMYFKFVPFNQFGAGKPSLDAVTAYSYTLQGTALTSPQPPAPTALTLTATPPKSLRASWLWSWDILPSSVPDDIQYRIYAEAPPTKKDYNTIFSDLPAYGDANGLTSAYANALYDMGITSSVGYTSKLTFSPDNPITREQCSKFLIQTWHGIAGGVLPPAQTGDTAYFDDLSDTTFTQYINLMKEKGITTGCGDRLYCPTRNLTRKEAAVFIVRLYNVKLGYNADYSLSTAGYTAYFNDVDSTYANYYQHINKLFELGAYWGITVYTGGSAQGSYTFSPDQNITRKELAVWVCKALGQAGSGVAYDANFVDIANDGSAAFINKLYELGGTSGTGTKYLFSPSGNIQQQHYAQMISQALGVAYGSIPVTVPTDPIPRDLAMQWLINALGESQSSATTTAYFSDLTGGDYPGYVNKGFELGLTVGTSSGTYSPDANLTRAQAAAFIVRAVYKSQWLTSVKEKSYTITLPDYARYISVRVWAELATVNVRSVPVQSSYVITAPTASTVEVSQG